MTVEIWGRGGHQPVEKIDSAPTRHAAERLAAKYRKSFARLGGPRWVVWVGHKTDIGALYDLATVPSVSSPSAHTPWGKYALGGIALAGVYAVGYALYTSKPKAPGGALPGVPTRHGAAPLPGGGGGGGAPGTTAHAARPAAASTHAAKAPAPAGTSDASDASNQVDLTGGRDAAVTPDSGGGATPEDDPNTAPVDDAPAPGPATYDPNTAPPYLPPEPPDEEPSLWDKAKSLVGLGDDDDDSDDDNKDDNS